jgi:S1-C subfamily serine protease
MLGSLNRKLFAAGACIAVGLAVAQCRNWVRAGSMDSVQPAAAPAPSDQSPSDQSPSDQTTSTQTLSDADGLHQLDQASQKLFAAVRPSVVEVDFPTPLWVRQLAMQYPLDKWRPHFDAEQWERLQEEIAAMGGHGSVRVVVTPATQPGEPAAQSGAPPMQPGEAPATEPSPQSDSAVATQPSADQQDADAQNEDADRIVPNILGVEIDARGDILVPMFLESEVGNSEGIPVVFSDGRIVLATFVGSDQLTNITVLHADNVQTVPAPMATAPMPTGSLAMLFPLEEQNTRLIVWTGGADDFSVVANAAGQISGFTSHGHFLQTSLFRPLAQQIVDHGSVSSRARLGVQPGPVGYTDPVRRQYPQLGEQPVLRVMKVMPGSPADLAGIRPGDLVLKVAGQDVSEVPTFAATIAVTRGPTDFQLMRDGQLMTLRIDLEPR